MKGIILAGGFGTRLKPLTDVTPKPMLPVYGRPCMEYAVDLLKKHGVKKIASTLHHQPQAIKFHFGDGRDFGVQMKYFVEESPLGTAGSVKQAEEFLDETFVVLSGDGVTDVNLSRLLRFHKKKKALVTMAVTPVEDPSQFGIVEADGEGRIKRFLEKPKPGEAFSNIVNMGIYILEPEVLDYIPKDTVFDFSKDLFPLLMAQDIPLYAYSMSAYWCDIGTREQYRQVHIDLMNGAMRDFVPLALQVG